MLVVCPHCGRELQPAPPRLLTWGAPLLLVGLFGVVLLTQLGGANPGSWTQRQVERVSTFVGNISSQLQVDLSIAVQPLEDDDSGLISQPAPPQEVAEVGAANDASPVEGEDNGASPENSDSAANVEAPPVQPTEATQPTVLPVDTPTAAPTPTAPPPTEAPTATPTSVPTATPTSVPTVGATTTFTSSARSDSTQITATAVTTSVVQVTLMLPTPTPAPPTATPRVYRIRTGDTLFDLALANDLSLEVLLAANNLSEDDVYTIQPGDEIIIPDPNASLEALETPTPSPAPTRDSVIHTVQSGDTLMAIGMRYGVNLQRILDANGMTLAQARALRPGQELIIPGDATPAPTATPTPTVQPTNAALPTATPVAAAPTSALRLDAPQLRTPEDQVTVSCRAGEQLGWLPVPFIQSTDVYVVHLGYVNGRSAAGDDQITWVIAQQRPSNVTLWQLDESLCGLAPLEQGRQWRWYVTVEEKATDGTLTPVSPASELWGFTWQ